MKKLTRDDKIGAILLAFGGIIALIYFYLWLMFNCSFHGLFEIICFYLGAIWCWFMVIACRKLRLFEDKDGVKE